MLPTKLNLFRSTLRSQSGASQIAEFIPVLYILFLLFLAPILDLANAFVAGAIQYLATNDVAAKVATQANYSGALNVMTNEAYQFQANSLAKFVHLMPAGGYTGCGDDMYVLATNVSSGAVSTSAANQGLTGSINTANTIYEISIKSAYMVEPLINLSSVPLIGSVPGLGTPMQLSFTANRPVEHPGGLQLSNRGASSQNGSVQPFQRIASIVGNGTNPASAASTWRTPNIYQMIQAAGQTIVTENVVLVEANNPNWISAGVAVSTGEMIYVDTQSVGTWNSYPEAGAPTTDANGYGGPTSTNPDMTNPALTGNSLDGKVGSAGTAFMLGDEQYNYPLPGSGILNLIMNDGLGDYGDNIGAQYVRVIVVR